jgi:hypothetical protein
VIQVRKEQEMRNTGSHIKGYVLAAVLGAMGGGLAVAVATNAIPKMMSGMMQHMMAHMRESGFNKKVGVPRTRRAPTSTPLGIAVENVGGE